MAAAAAAAMRGVGALGIMRGSAGAGDRHPLGGACSDVSVKVKSPHSSTAPASTIQYTMCARTYSGFVEVRTKGSVTVNPQKRNLSPKSKVISYLDIILSSLTHPDAYRF